MPKVFLCPNCFKSIPKIIQLVTNINFSTSIKLKCSCNPEPFLYSLSSFLSLLIQNQNCTNHQESKGTSYCIECKGWLCLPCQFSHQCNNSNHDLVSSTVLYSKPCEKHSCPLLHYCTTCQVHCCSFCAQEEHANLAHATISLKDYWDKVNDAKDLPQIEQIISTEKEKTSKLHEQLSSVKSIIDMALLLKLNLEKRLNERKAINELIPLIQSSFLIQCNGSFNYNSIRNFEALKFTNKLDRNGQMNTDQLNEIHAKLTSLTQETISLPFSYLINVIKAKQSNHQYTQQYLNQFHQELSVHSVSFTHKLLSKKMKDEITSVVVLPDSRIATTSLASNTISIWTYPGTTLDLTLKMRNTNAKLFVLWSGSLLSYNHIPSSSSEISEREEGIYQWSLATKKEWYLFNGNYSHIIQIKHNLICALHLTKNIYVFDIKEGKTLNSYVFPNDLLSLLYLDQNKIVFCSVVSVFKVWDPLKNCIPMVVTAKMKINSIIKLDVNRLAIGGESSQMQVYDTLKGENALNITTIYTKISKLERLNDMQFAVISGNYQVSLWNSENYQCELVMTGYDCKVSEVFINSEGALFIVKDNFFEVWD